MIKDVLVLFGCGTNRDWDIIYHYDIGAFLYNKYKGIFYQTNIARAIGIHESLIRKYLSAVRNSSKKTIVAYSK
jgi:hypothetical protein